MEVFKIVKNGLVIIIKIMIYSTVFWHVINVCCFIDVLSVNVKNDIAYLIACMLLVNLWMTPVM